MRVAVNATCISNRPSGAKQRFLGIYPELARLLPEVEFVIFEPADCRMSSWFSGLSNVQTQVTPIPSQGRFRKLFHSTRFWSVQLRQGSFDLFEGFHLPLPSCHSTKTIFTIHDLRYLQPDMDRINRTLFRQALTAAIKNSDIVVTVSESMRQELQPFCRETPIRVIPNALDHKAFHSSPTKFELEAFRRKFSLPDTFILSVGHFEARKNYARLVEALGCLRDACRSYHLLIVGNESGKKRELQAQIASLGLTDRVTLASGLSDREVRCAYELCQLFVFPSTYEGFGIPILEAMDAGRPIVLSDIPVFREIMQQHDAFFSPLSPFEIARVIDSLLSDRERQISLVSNGYDRLKSYDYSKSVVQYKDLYQELLFSA